MGRSAMPRSLLVLLLLVVVAVMPSAVLAANITLFCKCHCAPNVTILVVPRCASCSKAFCAEQQACFIQPPLVQIQLPPPSPARAARRSDESPATPSKPKAPVDDGRTVPVPTVAPDDDWVATCFQRGSYKDEVIVFSFLVIVGTLLLVAAAKPYWEEFMSDYNKSRQRAEGHYDSLQ